MSSRLALLTGATGFLGGHVARRLLEEGWRVRALVRSDPRNCPLLDGLNVEFVAGDLGGSGDLAAAAAGCHAVVHVAGLVKARTLEEYREVNRRGTERLVSSARRTAPEAVFVLVSSQAAAGPARFGRPVEPSDPARPVSWYGISKLEGEQAARQWPGPSIILRPGVVYGPGDRGLLTYFRMATRGFIPVPAARSRIQIGPAEQISLAIARAAARPDLGGATAFLCDPGPVSVGELAGLVAALPERRARLLPIPDFLVRAAGLLETFRENVTRESRAFNADKARELLAGEWICLEGLRTELGLQGPVPLDRGLRATWDWYRTQGWLIL